MKTSLQYYELSGFPQRRCKSEGFLGTCNVLAKPEGVTLWWRIKAAIRILRGKAIPVEWE